MADTNLTYLSELLYLAHSFVKAWVQCTGLARNPPLETVLTSSPCVSESTWICGTTCISCSIFKCSATVFESQGAIAKHWLSQQCCQLPAPQARSRQCITWNKCWLLFLISWSINSCHKVLQDYLNISLSLYPRLVASILAVTEEA